jgi:TolA-binding protein
MNPLDADVIDRYQKQIRYFEKRIEEIKKEILRIQGQQTLTSSQKKTT